eukprot:4854902-Lingulodinium_polyedra.AAC.1
MDDVLVAAAPPPKAGARADELWMFFALTAPTPLVGNMQSFAESQSPPDENNRPGTHLVRPMDRNT